MTKDNNTEAHDLLQPLVDLFSGADGGLAFTRMRHEFVPHVLERAAAGDEGAIKMLQYITIMSRLATTMLHVERLYPRKF